MDKFVIQPGTSGPVGQVAKYANLLNVQIVNTKSVNPYYGNISQDYTPDDALGISSLGTPIYTDLTLMGCQYTDNSTGNVITLPNDRFRQGGVSNSITNTQQKGGFYMNLETVLMTVNQPIKVIKTEIQGMDGTVKEYIGKDDAHITINGIITGANGQYPRSEVKRLQAWLDAPLSKDIVAWWLQNLGIHSLVVNSYSIPQVQGGYSYQMFSIDAISDVPVQLMITQPNT